MPRALVLVRAFVRLVQLELLRLARTDEVHTYLLIPALLGLPLLMSMTQLVATGLVLEATVAIPSDLPAALDLPRHLSDRYLNFVVSDDPRGAFERGEVDAAIVSWSEGSAPGSPPHAEAPALYTLDLLADTTNAVHRVRLATNTAGKEVVGDLVALGGGDPVEALFPATVRLPREDLLPVDAETFGLGFGAFTLGLVAMMFLALPQVADRREGVTEALRALPVPMAVVLGARVVAAWVVQMLGGSIAALNVYAFAWLAMEGTPLAAWHFVALGAVSLASTASYLLVGCVSDNARTANINASYAMTAQGALLVWGASANAPVWVPIAGVMHARSASDVTIAVIACVVAAVAVVALAGFALERRVQLVLRRGDE